MPAPLYTTEIDALITAIGSGTTRVTYEGKSVEYDNIDGLLRRLNYLRRLAGISTFSNSAVSSFDRGDDDERESSE